MASSEVSISLEDVLKGIVGSHYPHGSTELDNESIKNTSKLQAIAQWVAEEASLRDRVDDYLKSPYGSVVDVAKMHDKVIMNMLEWFEPQVKRYYKQYLKEDENANT